MVRVCRRLRLLRAPIRRPFLLHGSRSRGEGASQRSVDGKRVWVAGVVTFVGRHRRRLGGSTVSLENGFADADDVYAGPDMLGAQRRGDNGGGLVGER
jgi:hypothetical protein